MVGNEVDAPRCRDCKEVTGDAIGQYVYCPWLNCRVYGNSMMCKHGLDLHDSF